MEKFTHKKITLSIQDVFITSMDKLIEHKENLESPLHDPSHLKILKEKQ